MGDSKQDIIAEAEEAIQAGEELLEDAEVDGEEGAEDVAPTPTDMSKLPTGFDPNTMLLLEPKGHPSCRICSWSKTNIHLYNWVTEQAVVVGKTYNRIAAELPKYIEANCPGVPTASKKSVWAHFKRHLPPKAEARLMVSRNSYQGEQKLAKLEPDKAWVVQQARVFDEYTELCELFLSLKSVHAKIYDMAQSLQLENAAPNQELWSQTKIQTYASMVNTQKAILAEISKMRQGDKLVALAARFVIESFARQIVERLTREFKALAAVMGKQNVSESIMEAYADITHQRLAQIVMDEAQNTMEAARDKFKIPTN